MIVQCPWLDAQLFIDRYGGFRIGASVGFFVAWLRLGRRPYENLVEFTFVADGVRPDENGVHTTVTLIQWEIA